MSKISLFRHKDLHSTRSVKAKLDSEALMSRFHNLSQPKQRCNDEDLVGPGSYDPSDSSLSTKSKSPCAITPKATRFFNPKLPELKQSVKNTVSKESFREKSYNLINSPNFTFKRTGHNLKLVWNPEFPGAGRYSPTIQNFTKGGYFPKAKKDFSWKKSNF